MLVDCVWEHNGDDSLIYASNIVGAFSRGKNKDEALEKVPYEVKSFFSWLGHEVPSLIDTRIVQEEHSNINIDDADSVVIFDTEKLGLDIKKYQELKSIALKSANDMLLLYEAFLDKNKSCLYPRDTFYGKRPCTAYEMYEHTKNVNSYYFGEIGVDVSNEGSIVQNRMRGFEALEHRSDFLAPKVYEGSFDEQWSVKKVLRRFIWHDRIHAKAMYRMGIKTFGAENIPNVFKF